MFGIRVLSIVSLFLSTMKCFQTRKGVLVGAGGRGGVSERGGFSLLRTSIRGSRPLSLKWLLIYQYTMTGSHEGKNMHGHEASVQDFRTWTHDMGMLYHRSLRMHGLFSLSIFTKLKSTYSRETNNWNSDWALLSFPKASNDWRSVAGSCVLLVHLRTK